MNATAILILLAVLASFALGWLMRDLRARNEIRLRTDRLREFLRASIAEGGRISGHYAAFLKAIDVVEASDQELEDLHSLRPHDAET